MLKTGLECQRIPKKKKKKSTKSPDFTWISSNKYRLCFAQPSMVRLFFVLSCPPLFFFPGRGMKDLSFLTRDRTRTLCIGIAASWPLDQPLSYHILLEVGSEFFLPTLNCTCFNPGLEPCWLTASLGDLFCLLIMMPENLGPHTKWKNGALTPRPWVPQPPVCLRKVTWGTWVHLISWWPKPRSTFFFQPFSRCCLFFGSQIRLLDKTFYF